MIGDLSTNELDLFTVTLLMCGTNAKLAFVPSNANYVSDFVPTKIICTG